MYACASKNAQSCAQVPLRLYVRRNSKAKATFPTKAVSIRQKQFMAQSPTTCRYMQRAIEVEEVTEHPFLDLLEQVNDFMNGFDLLEHLFVSLDLTGNAYWYIAESSRPNEIWPLLPQFMTIIPSKENHIDLYKYGPSLPEIVDLEPETIVHFKYTSMKSSIYGSGPLQAALVPADLNYDMGIYEASLMKNRAHPDFAIITPEEQGKPGEDEQKAVEAKWRRAFGGIKNSGKPAWLYGGADVKKLSLSPKELSFLKGREATLEEIAAIFGVPMSKLGSKNVNRANAEAGDYSYMKDAIRTRLRKAEQKLNEGLIPRYDQRLFCAFDDPVPEDKEFRLQEVKSHLQTGYSSINEERELDGVEPAEWGDVPILSSTLVPFGSELPEAEPFVEPAKARVKAPRKLPPLGHPTNFVNVPFVRDMQGYYREWKKDILIAIHRDVKDVLADNYISSWINLGKQNGELTERLLFWYQETLTEAGNGAIAQALPDAQFNSRNPHVVNALDTHRMGAVQNINSTVVKKLRKDLAEGIGQGEGAAKLRKRVEAEFDDLERYQAANIARTETIWAWNEGAVQGYIQSGVVEQKQWLSSGDDRTCDYCPLMDGKIISVEGWFWDKGSVMVNPKADSIASLKFDYEGISHPPLHAQCRCVIVPVIRNI